MVYEPTDVMGLGGRLFVEDSEAFDFSGFWQGGFFFVLSHGYLAWTGFHRFR